MPQGALCIILVIPQQAESAFYMNKSVSLVLDICKKFLWRQVAQHHPATHAMRLRAQLQSIHGWHKLSWAALHSQDRPSALKGNNWARRQPDS